MKIVSAFIIDQKSLSIGKIYILASDSNIFFLSNSFTKTKQAAIKLLGSSASAASNKLSQKAFRQIEEYLGGKRKKFNLPLQIKGTDFQLRSWQALSNIAHGRDMTYQELADKIGHPRASRAVGSAVGKNPLPIIIPCHRVLAKNGLGGFSLGLNLKKKLLAAENNLKYF